MRVSPRQIRWALLLTTAVMAAVLLTTGIWIITSARTAARSLTRSQAIGASLVARRALRTVGSLDPDALQETLEDLKSEGVTYIGVMNPDGSLVASAGEAAEASTWLPAVHDIKPFTQPSRTGFHVRLESLLFEGLGRGGTGRLGRGWAHIDDPHHPNTGKGYGPWQALHAHRLILELHSETA
jgi:hypothetical protein